MRTTPTKKELNEVRKVVKQISALSRQKEQLERQIAEKYSPCKIGDIIEGGKNFREQGRVYFRSCFVWEDGYQIRISYYPLRGKRELKTRKHFHYPETIKVITPAS